MTSPSPLTPRVVDNGVSALVAYDFGAHLASWQVDGRPVVWVSERAVLDGTRAIRGGVPICFPWFVGGPDGDLSPSHGVARTATWRPEETSGDDVFAWALSDGDVAGAPGVEHLPGPFSARYAVSLLGTGGPAALRLSLAIHNPGAQPLRCEVALHTYLGVADVTQVQIEGLEGVSYLDKVTGRRERQDGPVRIAGETDSVYDSHVGRTGHVVVDDGSRRLELAPEGSTQTVVWNPGAKIAAQMSDLAPSEWRDFVCVESAATGDHALTIEAGATHTVSCTITVHDTSPA